MKFPMLRYLVCLSALLLLCACGDSNPLIGKWKADVSVSSGNADVDAMMKKMSGGSMEGHMTFTSSEMVAVRGSNEQRTKVSYRKDSDKSWSVSADGGKSWERFDVKDNDTIEQNAGAGIKLVLKRVK